MPSSIRINTGNTPLDLLSEEHGRHIWVKREDHNPFGTHKDRRSALIRCEFLKQAAEARPNAVVLISAGNAALSLRLMTADLPVSIRSIVPARTSRRIRNSLRRAGVEIRTTDREFLSSPAVLQKMRHSMQERMWNVTSGYDFAYAEIVREITEVVHPDVIACPIGSGELLVGVHRGLSQLGIDAKLVGVSVKAGARSKADKLEAWIRPYHAQIQELLRRGQLHQMIFDARDVRQSMRKVPRGIAAEPSAAVVFGVPDYLRSFKNLVLINTGKGIV